MNAGYVKCINFPGHTDSYTYRKVYFLLVFGVSLLFLSGREPLFALDRFDGSEDLWVCSNAEVAFFSVDSVSCGGGLTLGYGKGMAIGLKTAFLVDIGGQIKTLEFNFLFRIYFFGTGSGSGPYIQLDIGPTLFTGDGGFSLPSEYGSVSAGLSFGWRFLIGRYLFIEPVIRGGYPYIGGGGLHIGIHFWNQQKGEQID